MASFPPLCKSYPVSVNILFVCGCILLVSFFLLNFALLGSALPPLCAACPAAPSQFDRCNKPPAAPRLTAQIKHQIHLFEISLTALNRKDWTLINLVFLSVWVYLAGLANHNPSMMIFSTGLISSNSGGTRNWLSRATK